MRDLAAASPLLRTTPYLGAYWLPTPLAGAVDALALDNNRKPAGYRHLFEPIAVRG